MRKWHVYKSGQDYWITDGASKAVALVYSESAPAKDNARLIAAAPQMAQLLIESQTNIGGGWRQRRDEVLKRAGLL